MNSNTPVFYNMYKYLRTNILQHFKSRIILTRIAIKPVSRHDKAHITGSKASFWRMKAAFL